LQGPAAAKLARVKPTSASMDCILKQDHKIGLKKRVNESLPPQTKSCDVGLLCIDPLTCQACTRLSFAKLLTASRSRFTVFRAHDQNLG
jgi:hypothetical protein